MGRVLLLVINVPAPFAKSRFSNGQYHPKRLKWLNLHGTHRKPCMIVDLGRLLRRLLVQLTFEVVVVLHRVIEDGKTIVIRS